MDEKAQRRLKEMEGQGQSTSLLEVKESLIIRDSIDKTRADILFDRYSDEVITIDTTNLTIKEQIDKVLDQVYAC